MNESAEIVTQPQRKFNTSSQAGKPVLQRFWEKVDKNGPIPPHVPQLGNCWAWIATTASTGNYGIFDDPAFKDRRAHRISWIIHFGEIPVGYLVLHKCDNSKCVNPLHLELGDYQKNMDDRSKRGRCNAKKGDDNHFATLKPQQVIEMRARFNNGESKASIARIFGVAPQTVSKIILRRRWAHI